jgi:hypothetical protein
LTTKQNLSERVRDKVVFIPNGSNAGRVFSLVDRNDLRATLGLTSEHKVVVYIGRIAVETNVQALIDATHHLDESWHTVIIGPQYVPLERIGPRVHLLPAQRRIGNWLVTVHQHYVLITRPFGVIGRVELEAGMIARAGWAIAASEPSSADAATRPSRRSSRSLLD